MQDNKYDNSVYECSLIDTNINNVYLRGMFDMNELNDNVCLTCNDHSDTQWSSDAGSPQPAMVTKVVASNSHNSHSNVSHKHESFWSPRMITMQNGHIKNKYRVIDDILKVELNTLKEGYSGNNTTDGDSDISDISDSTDTTTDTNTSSSGGTAPSTLFPSWSITPSCVTVHTAPEGEII